MEYLTLLLCVVPTLVMSITISPNGNSPERKMIGGMMVDVQKGFMPMTMTPKPVETTPKITAKRKLSASLPLNSTKLSINERYRRLIPYMTFYYANDLSSTTEPYNTKDVEVEKAQIIEAQNLEQQNQRQQKKIIYSPFRNIPRYQGNRLTQFNIASADPVKVYYKEVPSYQNQGHNSHKIASNYNPIVADNDLGSQDPSRFVPKIVKYPSVPFSLPSRKPYNTYHYEDTGNTKYYSSNGETPQYKLIPYDQTPPVKVNHHVDIYNARRPVPVPVLVTKEPVYIKPRPRPQYVYDDFAHLARKPAVVSESYYEKKYPVALGDPPVQPVIEDGFKPIAIPALTTERATYTTIAVPTPTPLPQIEDIQDIPKPTVQIEESQSPVPETHEVNSYRPNYYQYVVDKKPFKVTEGIPPKSTSVSLADLLNSLQLNKSIPKPITRDNVGASIRTLLQVLNALKVMSHQNEVEAPILSSPRPYIDADDDVIDTPKSILVSPTRVPEAVDLHHDDYLAPVNPPSQHLDDFSSPGSSSQQFPPPVHSDDEGGTPGRPGVDYPILTTIPPTSFNCKTQRYKGFFADPETRCQVWHYCDLNGGQASFLCPNGTIFSQAGLTCDWWFNVRCDSTTQLYVLNESLYKYILPHSPKFPEDYSGPLVDKYLTLKFKEMEEQFKKNKNKNSASEKSDSDEEEESVDDSSENINNDSESNSERNVLTDKSDFVSEASVDVQTPGTSGNVARLDEE